MTTPDFTHTTPAVSVVFGSGTLGQASGEAERLGLDAVVVITTPGQTKLAAHAVAALGPRTAGSCALAAMHTPVEMTDRAEAALAMLNPDGLLAIGGESAIGLGKALAVRRGLPLMAVLFGI